jgi:mRNA-degrading endonuclease RelE of RelBE toxin-antitoxin system
MMFYQNRLKEILRVGDYRIVYDLETDSVMRVRLIAHRSRVYKDLARLLRS